MAFVGLEDYDATAEVIVFPKLFKKVEAWLENYNAFVVKGISDEDSLNSKCKIKAIEIVPVELFFQEWGSIESMTFRLPNNLDMGLISEIKKNMISGKTPLILIFSENGKFLKIKTKRKINLDINLIERLKKQDIHVSLKPQ